MRAVCPRTVDKIYKNQICSFIVKYFPLILRQRAFVFPAVQDMRHVENRVLKVSFPSTYFSMAGSFNISARETGWSRSEFLFRYSNILQLRSKFFFRSAIPSPPFATPLKNPHSVPLMLCDFNYIITQVENQLTIQSVRRIDNVNCRFLGKINNYRCKQNPHAKIGTTINETAEYSSDVLKLERGKGR